MALPPLSAEQQAQAQELADQLRPRLERLLQQMAQQLVANSDAPFGQPEFDLRDLLHQAGADALQACCAQKKTATTGPG